MTLRRRLALVTALVAVPQVLLLLGWDLRSRRAAAEERLGELLSGTLNAEEARRCLADPVGWGGVTPPPGPPPGEEGLSSDPDAPHGKPPVLWAYAEDGAPARADAPTLPGDLIHALSPGRVQVAPTSWHSADLRVVARTGWGGACEIALMEGSTVRGWVGAVLPASPLWLAPLVGSVAGILIAAGSVVERIRRLTDAVRQSAEGGPRPLPVQGDDEVAELARAFDEAGRALQEQVVETQRRERALREFLANTSHDVLLPLTVLRGHLSALRDQAELGPVDRSTLASAMDEAHYLGALVHDLAAVASLEAAEHTLVKHPVDLLALVERVAARHRPIGRERGVEVVSALPGTAAVAAGDVTLLEQALNNLVYNAIRYNRPGGHVAIVLEVEPAAFALRVFDDGPGVSDAALQRLSERGFRTDEARGRAPEGLGLGLSIAARVADAHGFTLAFSHAEAGGLEARLSGALMGDDAERRPESPP